jgi:hypothetical protein
MVRLQGAVRQSIRSDRLLADRHDGSDARRGSYQTCELQAHGFSRIARGAQSELAAIVSHTT